VEELGSSAPEEEVKRELPEMVQMHRPVTRGPMADGGREAGRLPLVLLTPEEVMAAEQAQADGTLDEDPMQLAVKLAPQRPRTLMTFFTDQLLRPSDFRRPKLIMFEKVKGSRVCEGVMPNYVLPNGKQAHFYYYSQLVDECEVMLRPPPPRPKTLKDALQHTIPLDIVLAEVNKPGNGPSAAPFRPVPPPAPFPERHTLRVREPHSLKPAAFGVLAKPIMQFVIVPERVVQHETRTTREPIRHRTPWTLPISIFKPRKKESDAKDWLDKVDLMKKMFLKDWERLQTKDKFLQFLLRENKSNPKGVPPDAFMASMQKVLEENYNAIACAFEYYAALGSGSPHHLQLNSYSTFLDAAQIPDPESFSIKRSDCDTIFITANFVQDKKSKMYEVNDEHALMRFEFIEMLVRVASAKYGKDVDNQDLVMGLERLLRQNFLPNLPGVAIVHNNTFREQRLYFEDVDLVLKKHKAMLQAIYSRYRLPPKGGGLRKKMLYMDGWAMLLEDAKLIDDNFTVLEARLCYLWARMKVIDEINEYDRYTAHTFVDFLEAIGRLADVKALPSQDELKEFGFENVYAWLVEQATSPTEIIPRRPSMGIGAVATRPLSEKLDILLDCLFRGIWDDQKNKGHEYDYAECLKHVQKIDKALGP